MLSLKLLGGAAVERAGLPVPGRAARGRQLALLALLSRGRPLSRDKLLALLWPESDTDRGRRFLSDSLYLLRGALGEEVVTAAGDDLRLNAELVSSDVVEFERLLEERHLDAAIRLYQGPFLDGFHLAESSEFEQWVDAERDRLARLHQGALEGLAEEREKGREWRAAVGWWRKLATLEPGNGRIALRLMRALDAAGDRAGALQHARVHTALLREEFDADPDPEIVQLTEQLKRESAARRRTPTATPTIEEAPPGPVAQTSALPAPEPVSPRSGRRIALAAAMAVVVIGGAALALSRSDDTRLAADAAPARRSIAVLPFANLSPDSADVYFSHGLTDELIGTLSRIEGLRVAARTSSFAVGAGNLDVRTIGDTLGVATVLEGSVRQDGERLRVTAQLADAATGYQIWSEEYDRELKDVFAVQDEIARAIARALRMRLMGDSAGAAGRRRRPALEAHDLYLRGVYFRNKLTNDALTRAVEYFDRAIQADSGYALAYAGKATAIGPLVWYDFLPRAQGMPAMREAAARALELDETLGEAHVAQGMLHFYFEWDWPATEREFRRAVQLNPNDQHAHHMYANYLVAMGRLDEAITHRTHALELDPLSVRSGTLLGRDYYIAGQYDRAIAQYRRTAEIDSTSPLALGLGQEATFGLGDVYERQGKDAEAVKDFLRIAALEGLNAGDLGQLRQAFAESGIEGYWRRRLALELQRPTPPEPLRVASLLARIGDADQAASWIDRAYHDSSMALPFLGVMPVYERVRSHPKVVRILRDMKLPGAGPAPR